MRHSQKLLGDVNLELQIEKEEVQRTARRDVARSPNNVETGLAYTLRARLREESAYGRARERGCGRVYASGATGRGGTVLSSARAAAGAGVAAGEGWGGLGGCRRGSVRMISEGVSTRMCASASRSPPAVTVTLGARTPPVTAVSAGVLVAPLAAPAAVGAGGAGGAAGAGAGAAALAARGRGAGTGAGAAGWLGSPSPAVCRAPNCLHHVARERTTACP